MIYGFKKYGCLKDNENGFLSYKGVFPKKNLI